MLSDEIVAVRRLDDGWRVFGTPFWGDFARGGISMRSWPLRTVAFLNQAREVAMTPITSSDATLRLLGCFLAFTTDRASVERSLAVAVQLCAEVRSVEASLTRTAPTATVFRKLAPHLGPEVTRQVPPANARELISEFRALLRKQRSYAFRPKGDDGAAPGSRAASRWRSRRRASARRSRRATSSCPGFRGRRPTRTPSPATACRASGAPRTPGSEASCSAASRWSRATARRCRCRAGSAIWPAASARWSRSPC